MKSKSVRVGYGIFNNPNNKAIEKKINKWGKQGYRLTTRTEHTPGCLTMMFTLGWARGRTDLTFIKEDE